MPIHLIQKQFQKVARGLPIVTAYLFGSRARNQAGPISDFDIAVQSRPGLSAAKRFQLKLTLIDRLAKLFKTDAVDVVLLEEATPLLAHRILKEGKVLYCSNPKQRVQKEFEVLTTYLDFHDDLDLYARAVFGLAPQRTAHG
jgi:predicted nucleotidyltransferase